MSTIEKVSLWLHATQQSSPAVNEKEKESLLAQLNGIDDEPQPIYNSTPAPQERNPLITDHYQACYRMTTLAFQKNQSLSEKTVL